MPVYFHFKSMEKLEEEIVTKALALLLEYQSTSRSGDPLLDVGIGYLAFAKEEQHLFKGINEKKHSHLLTKHGQMNFDMLRDTFLRDSRFKKYTEEECHKILFILWVFVHGLAQLNNNLPLEKFEIFDLTRLLKRTAAVFVKGIDGYLAEGKNVLQDP
jgi:hypothetical protein